LHGIDPEKSLFSESLKTALKPLICMGNR